MPSIVNQSKPNWKMGIGIPLLIFISCIAITFSTTFTQNKILISNAILFDLIITAPLFYLVAIWGSKISKLSVLRIVTLGIIVAGLILDTKNLVYLRNIKFWLAPIIEFIIIFYVARFFINENKKRKKYNSPSSDFLTLCRIATTKFLGNEILANIISSELAVFYYSFFSWSSNSIDYKNRFSNYKQNGILIVLYAIFSILIIETIGMHFLLRLYSKILAWIISGISIYSCLQIFGHIRAIKSRPVILADDCLEIHNGLAGDAIINYNNIESIELTKQVPTEKVAVKIALLKGLENHNVVINLKSSILVYKFFGIKKQCNSVLFFVDKPDLFVNIVKNNFLTQQRTHDLT